MKRRDFLVFTAAVAAIPHLPALAAPAETLGWVSVTQCPPTARTATFFGLDQWDRKLTITEPIIDGKAVVTDRFRSIDRVEWDDWPNAILTVVNQTLP